MWCVSYFLCLFIFHQVHENSGQVSYPYIVSIKLKLQEDKIPRLVAESLFGNNTILAQYFDYSHVSLNDVSEVIGTRNITVYEAFKALEIDFYDISNVISRKTVTNIVEAGNVNIHHFYSTFLQYFVTNPMKDVPKILNCLNIDNQKFSTAVVFGTDKELLEILLGGIYTKTNVEMALAVVNQDVTLQKALRFVKAARLGEALVTIKNTSSAMHIFDTLTILLDEEKVLQFLKYLNISANRFYRNEAFSKVLKNIVDTKEELVGSVISSESIITNSNSKTLIDYEFLKNYTQLTATFIDNSDMYNVILESSISSSVLPIAKLPIIPKPQLKEYLNVTSHINPRKLKNCTYVSLNVLCNTLYIENVAVSLDDSDFLILNKTNGTIFNVGSPLICDKYLYGVAHWEYETYISFLSIHSETKTTETNSLIITDEGYVAIAMNYVKQARALVLNSICNLLQFVNVNVCSNMFIP